MDESTREGVERAAGPETRARRARWGCGAGNGGAGLAIHAAMGAACGVAAVVTRGWDVGGYREVRADSWKLAAAVAAMALAARVGVMVARSMGLGRRLLGALCGFGVGVAVGVVAGVGKEGGTVAAGGVASGRDGLLWGALWLGAMVAVTVSVGVTTRRD